MQIRVWHRMQMQLFAACSSNRTNIICLGFAFIMLDTKPVVFAFTAWTVTYFKIDFNNGCWCSDISWVHLCGQLYRIIFHFYFVLLPHNIERWCFAWTLSYVFEELFPTKNRKFVMTVQRKSRLLFGDSDVYCLR